MSNVRDDDLETLDFADESDWTDPRCHWCGSTAVNGRCPESGNGRHEYLDD